MLQLHRPGDVPLCAHLFDENLCLRKQYPMVFSMGSRIIEKSGSLCYFPARGFGQLTLPQLLGSHLYAGHDDLSIGCSLHPASSSASPPIRTSASGTSVHRLSSFMQVQPTSALAHANLCLLVPALRLLWWVAWDPQSKQLGIPASSSHMCRAMKAPQSQL